MAKTKIKSKITACPTCRQTFWSDKERKYAELFGHCMLCDARQKGGKKLDAEMWEVKTNMAAEGLK